MEPIANPLAILTFVSAPAVLTNASCVLLFGTGNRYARAVDRMHELAKQASAMPELPTDEDRFRVRQLQAAERRSLLIVRALTCFYSSVAAFVTATLITLIGAILAASAATQSIVAVSYIVGFLAGTAGVAGLVTGSLLLVRETRESFVVLREENRIIAGKLARQAA